jgi:hypothetical protein
MNIELILWIVSGIIIWEIVYILFIKYNEDTTWIGAKLVSLFLVGLFMVLQFCILQIGTGHFKDEVFSMQYFNYMNLFWEALVIIGLVLFFSLNKWIADEIQKEK